MTAKAKEKARAGQARQRYILPSGTVTELNFDGDTDPTQLENLVANAGLLDEEAIKAGLIPANQTQGKAAVAASGVTPSRDDNLLFHAVSMDITPAPGDLAKVALFGNTHKQPRDDFAEVSMSNWKIAELQKVLKPYYEFKLDTFRRAMSFSVDFMVEYYNSSKMNTAGNPYKNFKQIHVKDGATPPAIMSLPSPPPPRQEPVEQPTNAPDAPVHSQDENPF